MSGIHGLFAYRVAGYPLAKQARSQSRVLVEQGWRKRTSDECLQTVLQSALE